MTTNTKTSPISVLDLTVAQTEQIEEELGLPMSKWRDAPSLARLITTVLAAVENNDRKVYAGLTMKELMDRVDISGDPDPEA